MTVISGPILGEQTSLTFQEDEDNLQHLDRGPSKTIAEIKGLLTDRASELDPDTAFVIRHVCCSNYGPKRHGEFEARYCGRHLADVIRASQTGSMLHCSGIPAFRTAS